MAGFAAPDEQAAWSDFVFVSDRQRQSFRTRFGIDGAVLRNAASPGVLDTPLSPACFLDRGEDPVLIYASGPTHGLDLLLIAFASIRERLPGARLLICADNRLYQKNGASDPSATLYALARALPGVELVGSLSQTALGAQFARADILAYPTNFVETSCIAAIEAASAGCLFAGTDYGALRETLAGFGVFIPISGARRQLEQAFADLVITTVEDARANPETFKRRRLEQAAMFRATHSWERRAAEWEAWLEQRLGAKFQR